MFRFFFQRKKEKTYKMENWVGKVALITDAAFSFGPTIVEALVEHGVIVVGTAHRLENLEKHAQKLSDKKGKLIPFKLDLFDYREKFLDVFKWVEDNVGPVQIFIANVGHCGEFFLSEARAEYNVKATNLCNGIKAAVEVLKKAEMGHIIHINLLSEMFYADKGTWNVPDPHIKLNKLMDSLKGELNTSGSKIKVSSVTYPNIPIHVGKRSEVYKRIEELAKQISEDVLNILSTFPLT